MVTTNGPLFGDIGLVALVYHNWGSIWLTPHHVLSRLGHYFHVVWCEPPHEWRDFRKSIKKWRSLSANSDFCLPSAFHLYPPEPWLPRFYRPDWIDKFTFEQRLKHAASRLKREGCRKLVLSLWHPDFEAALKSHSFDLKMYHIDDEYSFSPTPGPIDVRELRILRSVDQVFVVSPHLLERKGKINPHTAFMPEGVDYQLYASQTAEPEDLAPIPHPRIGYSGSLKRQLNWDLLRELAAKHPEWHFVFVGPVKARHGIEQFINEMSQQKNVHFLGPKSVVALASYPQHFDVCIMPYRIDGYTNNIYPLKLHEYLASGRPIVSSPIRSLTDFVGVIGLAEDGEGWSRALASALNPITSCQTAVAGRRKIARKHDWGNLIHSLARTVCERLGAEYSQRFSKVTAQHPTLSGVEQEDLTHNSMLRQGQG